MRCGWGFGLPAPALPSADIDELSWLRPFDGPQLEGRGLVSLSFWLLYSIGFAVADDLHRRGLADVDRDRGFADSPQEGGVRSEPVSEIQVYSGRFWRGISWFLAPKITKNRNPGS
jgi:hypothetical protein